MDFSKSKNVVTENGILNATTLIAPGKSALIHHVMPADDTQGWSCGWGCSGEFLTQEEAETALKAATVADV
jgi:hypothetical protein